MVGRGISFAFKGILRFSWEKNAASHWSNRSNWSNLVLCPVQSQGGHWRRVAVLSMAVLTFSFEIMIINLSVSQTICFGDEWGFVWWMHTSALVVLLMAPLFSKALTTLACYQWKTLRLLLSLWSPWSLWSLRSLRLLWLLQWEAAFFSQLKCKITQSKKYSSPNHAPSVQCSQRKERNLCPPRVLGSP